MVRVFFGFLRLGVRVFFGFLRLGVRVQLYRGGLILNYGSEFVLKSTFVGYAGHRARQVVGGGLRVGKWSGYLILIRVVVESR